MEDMPRPRKPYVHHEKNRHGKWVWYYRKDRGPRWRLRGEYESKEWLEDYECALAGKKPQARSADSRTLQWLVDQYLASGRFKLLAESTRVMRKRALLNVCETAGALHYASVTSDHIQAGKMRREGTPSAASNYVKLMSQLFAFAKDQRWVTKNPAAEIDAKAPKTDGHHTWTIEEVERYQARHPIGTQARLALDVLLYTGMRRSDAVMFGRQHVKGGIIRYRSIKTGMEVEFPMLPPLAASIAATPTGELAFLCTSFRKPWVSESFGEWFKQQCKEAGVPGRAHGLRKAGATFAAMNGANGFQLAAMYGWANPRMADVYVRKANKALLARQAAHALFPHLSEKKPEESAG